MSGELPPSTSCYGVSRSDDVVDIQITVFDTRTAEQKKALFKRTAELLGETRHPAGGCFIAFSRPRRRTGRSATASRNSPEATASGNQNTLISRDVPEGSPMVSTYFAYNSIVRNLRQSMTRVAQQPDVSRNAAYYKANIGKVKTVDDFMKNYRLYQYAMKAYGLEDMAYAKAFMKKVLQSDLSDPNSYANKLVDKRYREFAAAFSFGGSEAPIAQSANQTDEMIGLYTATMTRQVDAIDEDTRYYNLTIGSVTNRRISF